MEFRSVCILTDNAPRLAAFYETVLEEAPLVEGSHYSFAKAQLSVYDPGGVTVAADKNMQLIYTVPNLMATYERLLKQLPGLRVVSPPQRRPWGAFSFWFLDPDGNTVSILEQPSGTSAV